MKFQHQKEQGFTLIETMIAAVITVVIVLGLSSGISFFQKMIQTGQTKVSRDTLANLVKMNSFDHESLISSAKANLTYANTLGTFEGEDYLRFVNCLPDYLYQTAQTPIQKASWIGSQIVPCTQNTTNDGFYPVRLHSAFQDSHQGTIAALLKINQNLQPVVFDSYGKVGPETGISLSDQNEIKKYPFFASLEFKPESIDGTKNQADRGIFRLKIGFLEWNGTQIEFKVQRSEDIITVFSVLGKQALASQGNGNNGNDCQDCSQNTFKISGVVHYQATQTGIQKINLPLSSAPNTSSCNPGSRNGVGCDSDRFYEMSQPHEYVEGVSSLWVTRAGLSFRIFNGYPEDLTNVKLYVRSLQGRNLESVFSVQKTYQDIFSAFQSNHANINRLGSSTPSQWIEIPCMSISTLPSESSDEFRDSQGKVMLVNAHWKRGGVQNEQGSPCGTGQGGGGFEGGGEGPQGGNSQQGLPQNVRYQPEIKNLFHELLFPKLAFASSTLDPAASLQISGAYEFQLQGIRNGQPIYSNVAYVWVKPQTYIFVENHPSQTTTRNCAAGIPKHTVNVKVFHDESLELSDFTTSSNHTKVAWTSIQINSQASTQFQEPVITANVEIDKSIPSGSYFYQAQSTNDYSLSHSIQKNFQVQLPFGTTYTIIPDGLTPLYSSQNYSAYPGQNYSIKTEMVISNCCTENLPVNPLSFSGDPIFSDITSNHSFGSPQSYGEGLVKYSGEKTNQSISSSATAGQSGTTSTLFVDQPPYSQSGNECYLSYRQKQFTVNLPSVSQVYFKQTESFWATDSSATGNTLQIGGQSVEDSTKKRFVEIGFTNVQSQSIDSSCPNTSDRELELVYQGNVIDTFVLQENMKTTPYRFDLTQRNEFSLSQISGNEFSFEIELRKKSTSNCSYFQVEAQKNKHYGKYYKLPQVCRKLTKPASSWQAGGAPLILHGKIDNFSSLTPSEYVIQNGSSFDDDSDSQTSGIRAWDATHLQGQNPILFYHVYAIAKMQSTTQNFSSYRNHAQGAYTLYSPSNAETVSTVRAGSTLGLYRATPQGIYNPSGPEYLPYIGKVNFNHTGNWLNTVDFLFACPTQEILDAL